DGGCWRESRYELRPSARRDSKSDRGAGEVSMDAEGVVLLILAARMNPRLTGRQLEPDLRRDDNIRRDDNGLKVAPTCGGK
ncbi:MAG: hypothetical protein ABI311_10425, partial [Gemmatimonadaceae bacterium]